MRNILLILFAFNSVELFCQEIKSTEVKVLENFNPVMPIVEKIRETTYYEDTTKINKIQSYKSIKKTLNTNFKSRVISPAKVTIDQSFLSNQTSIYLGLGSQFHSSSDISYNSIFNDKTYYGLRFTNLFRKYKIDDYFDNIYFKSENEIYSYAKKVNDNNIYFFDLEYKRKKYKHESELYERLFEQKYNFSKIGVTILSMNLSKEKIRYRTDFHITDLNNRSENNVNITVNLDKYINNIPIKLKLDYNQYLNYFNEKSLNIRDRKDIKKINLYPSVNIHKFGYKFDVGASFYTHNDKSEKNKISLFPVIRISKTLVENILFLEGGLNHKNSRSTIKSIIDVNPFVRALGTQSNEIITNYSLELKNTNINEIYIKMKNIIGINEVFNGSISYGKLDNMMFFYFINDTVNEGKFYSSYIDVCRLKLQADYKWSINDLISINASANYFKYDTLVPNKENINGKLDFLFNLEKKIELNTNISYIGKRKSVRGVVLNDESSEIFWNDIYHLNSRIHANISIKYNYSDNITAYMFLNNILNSREFIYEDYREIGINTIFGFHYSF